jgi:hypothetical protein
MLIVEYIWSGHNFIKYYFNLKLLKSLRSNVTYLARNTVNYVHFPLYKQYSEEMLRNCSTDQTHLYISVQDIQKLQYTVCTFLG